MKGQPEKGKPGSAESYRVQEYFNVLKSDTTVISGPYELWYKGFKLVSGNFSNNEKNGLWKFNNLTLPFIESHGITIDSLAKDIYYQGYYKNDKKNGVWKYYLNKKPLCIIYFKDNLRDSVWKSFYPNGMVRYIINYKNGLQNGLYEYFSEKGTKLISKEYSNEILNGNYLIYDVTGEIKTNIEYKKGIPFNILALKDRSGNKLDPGSLKDGTGTLNYYDKDDLLTMMETYKNGVRDGLTEKYYASSGKICERGTYTNGIKNSDWEYLKSDGSKEKTIVDDSFGDLVDTTKKKPNADFVTMFAENRPQPQGGDAELQSFIESNLNMNQLFNNNNKELSRVYEAMIHFAVSATGKIYHLEFDHNFDKKTKSTIQNAFKAMPPWIPGFDKGFPVEFYYSLPLVKSKY